MQVDLDYYYVEGTKLPENVPVWNSGENCIIRMFGVTQDGQSCLAHIHNFQMYLWVELINMEEAPDE